MHKNVMAAASDYFAAMFESNFADSKNKEYVVHDVDGKTLQKIVQCCYTGEIVLDGGCVFDVIKAADYLGFLFTSYKCVKYLLSTLALENCVSYIECAEQFNLDEVRTQSVELICKQFDQITPNQLQEMSAKILHDVLKSDKIEAPEEMVFDKLKEWADGNEAERSADVPNLVKHIQFERICGNVSYIFPLFDLLQNRVHSLMKRICFSFF